MSGYFKADLHLRCIRLIVTMPSSPLSALACNGPDRMRHRQYRSSFASGAFLNLARKPFLHRAATGDRRSLVWCPLQAQRWCSRPQPDSTAAALWPKQYCCMCAQGILAACLKTVVWPTAPPAVDSRRPHEVSSPKHANVGTPLNPPGLMPPR
ncbi:hypothetical protein C7974DRAFT_225215 [Boeremia exigua]|uniref:uncharacterized protein n=1 Tax=Boeremia exigua TaxID=749465 RepID=UPI001E8E409D|nr:uncharacterized protein C7974DRAFT_225215 [Boeremia exigua]KAH6620044.1 hypothetical protein C7974DRAFT_225215 [Boeremia exigua]